MLGLVHLSPSVFPIDQRTQLVCAADNCTKPVLFCEAVIWNWHNGTTFANAGFCSNACALNSMALAGMPRA